MSRQEVRNAAIILLSLPDEDAAPLLRALRPEQVEAVAREIAGIDRVGAEEQQAALRLFSGDGAVGCVEAHGGITRAEHLVRSALGQQAEGVIWRLRRMPAPTLLAPLANVGNRTLARLLGDEHPQTIAAILAHLPTKRVAEILEGLRPEQRLGIMHRIATIGQVSAELIGEVAQVLARRAARTERESSATGAWPLAS